MNIKEELKQAFTAAIDNADEGNLIEGVEAICSEMEYKDTLPDGTPNPTSKAVFSLQAWRNQVNGAVARVRAEKAEDEALKAVQEGMKNYTVV